ncbi:MAG: hypothetical protein JHC98_04720 [Thermoleophilaceae bacterium]|nr:hypothetical protein [Thermoleophilaceae bacterium]
MAAATSDLTADGAIDWLLAADEPGVRLMARRDLLGESVAAEDAAEVMSGPKVQALMSGQMPDGGFGVKPYSKWSGAHWRLVSLVELGVPPGEPNLLAAAETVLEWLTSEKHRGGIQVIDGLTRRCASREGNAVAVACRLGMAGDPRVELLARSLVEWQWPDGARDAALRTAELLVQHRLFRSLKTGRSIDSRWLKLRFPPYWHYGILQALTILTRLTDGRWPAEGRWYKHDVLDWGGSGPNEMITLNALRVLAATGK